MGYMRRDVDPEGPEWNAICEVFSPKDPVPLGDIQETGVLLEALKEPPTALLGSKEDDPLGKDASQTAWEEAQDIWESLPGGRCRRDEVWYVVHSATRACFAVMLSARPDLAPSILAATLRGSGDAHAIACLAPSYANRLFADGSAS